MFHEGTEEGLSPCEASHTRLGSWDQQTQDRKHRAIVIPEGRVQEGGWGDFKGATKYHMLAGPLQWDGCCPECSTAVCNRLSSCFFGALSLRGDKLNPGCSET